MTRVGVILAGGLEKRFSQTGRPYSKALTPILGAPLLHWLCWWLKPHVSEIRVACGLRTDVRLAAQQVPGVQAVSGPTHGTAISASGALAGSNATVAIVMNGDTINELDAGAMLKAHVSGDVSALVAISRFREAQNPNALFLGLGGEVVSSAEAEIFKSRENCASVEAVASTGVFSFSGAPLRELIQTSLVSMEEQFVPGLIQNGVLNFYDNSSRLCIDIGSQAGLEILNRNLHRVEEYLSTHVRRRSLPL